jgi:predicted dehydrogenase/threonine dehydrogenase-like Zn-dependent dehydrogenase
LQSLKDGTTEVAETSPPHVRIGELLIRTRRSLVSAGTERMLLDFGKAGWLEKARQQPDKVREVFEKIRTDGLFPTVEAVRSKLDFPLALGYCNVGEVIGLGEGTSGFKIGDRVLSNGSHAEIVSVPVNLCAKIPDEVDDDEAVFAVLGAVALQGIRLLEPTLGECVVVTGLGLVGLLAVQLLRAHGCRVLGIDLNSERCALARAMGAETVDLEAKEDPLMVAKRFSRNRGVDAVLIAVSSKSDEPVRQAASMCRKRGRIVLVGVTGLQLSRADFYEKELSFQVSCSYGPGRHDPDYEEKGRDYPVGFVRWTEQRNFEAVLDLIGQKGGLTMDPLISHRFPIAEAVEAYDVLGGIEPCLGILIEYPQIEDGFNSKERTIQLSKAISTESMGDMVSFIGSGNYARRFLIPAFQKAGASFRIIVSSGGVSGSVVGRKFSFDFATTEMEEVFNDDKTGAVVIASRHNNHASTAIKALHAGKHVFVEKPLCLELGELEEIAEAVLASGQLLMVGFNRRFAPQVLKIKKLLDGVTAQKSFVMTVNAGAIAENHWTQDLEMGGGRIVGECCHFLDLLRFLAGHPIVEHRVVSIDSSIRDTVTITMDFADGSIGAIHYLANGSKAFPKERLEVFVDGRILQLDNFRKLSGFGWPNFRKMNLWFQNKGQKSCVEAFLRFLNDGGEAPIPLEEIIEVSRVAIEAQKACVD